MSFHLREGHQIERRSREDLTILLRGESLVDKREGHNEDQEVLTIIINQDIIIILILTTTTITREGDLKRGKTLKEGIEVVVEAMIEGMTIRGVIRREVIPEKEAEFKTISIAIRSALVLEVEVLKKGFIYVYKLCLMNSIKLLQMILKLDCKMFIEYVFTDSNI